MVIFTTLFGYIYELAPARNEPQFSHSLDPLLTSSIAMSCLIICKYIEVVVMSSFGHKQDIVYGKPFLNSDIWFGFNA
jgi:hypothetical protein